MGNNNLSYTIKKVSEWTFIKRLEKATVDCLSFDIVETRIYNLTLGGKQCETANALTPPPETPKTDK